MRNPFVIVILTILMAAGGLLTGCGKKEGQVVARVGDREIYIEDVDNYFKRVGANFISAEAERNAKREILDSLIAQHLLIIGAYERKMENENQVVKVVEGEEIKFLLDVLFDKEIISKAKPSESEIKDWYNRSSDEIKASHILVDSLNLAQEILGKLKDGAVFEELAIQYSTDPSAKRNQGDLGWFTWGMMVDNFQEAAFALKPGEMSAPVKTDFGYHIIRLAERRAIEHRPSFEEMHDQIQNVIVERRKRTLMQNYAEQLKKKYPVTVEEPTCQFVLNKLAFLYPDSIGSMPRWRNDIDPNQLDRDEKALVLGRYQGGQLTLGEYLQNLQRLPRASRPDFDNYDSLATIVFQMSFMNILGIEARAKGLDKDKKYLDKVQRFRELAMADLLRNDSIPAGIEIAEEDVKNYYDSHPDEFITPRRYHLLELQVADEETARRQKRAINSEEQFKQVAGRETLRPGKKQAQGDLGIIYREQYPELYDAAEKAQGRITDPVSIGNKWSIAWIKKRYDPEQKDFESVRQTIVTSVTQAKSDSAYYAYLDDMKKRIAIEIIDKVLTASVDESKYKAADSTQTP